MDSIGGFTPPYVQLTGSGNGGPRPLTFSFLPEETNGHENLEFFLHEDEVDDTYSSYTTTQPTTTTTTTTTTSCQISKRSADPEESLENRRPFKHPRISTSSDGMPVFNGMPVLNSKIRHVLSDHPSGTLLNRLSISQDNLGLTNHYSTIPQKTPPVASGTPGLHARDWVSPLTLKEQITKLTVKIQEYAAEKLSLLQERNHLVAANERHETLKTAQAREIELQEKSAQESALHSANLKIYYTTELSREKERYQTLHSELHVLHQKYYELGKLEKSQQQQIKLLTSERDSLLKNANTPIKNNNYPEQITMLEAKQLKDQEEIKALNLSIDLLRESNSKVGLEVDSYKGVIKKYKKEIFNLTNLLQHAKVEEEKSKTQIELLFCLRDGLIAQLLANPKELSESTELKKIQKKLNSTIQNDDKNNQIKDLAEEIKQLLEDITVLKKKKIRFANRNANYKKQIDGDEQEKFSLMSEINTLNYKCTKLEEEKKELKKQYKEVKKYHDKQVEYCKDIINYSEELTEENLQLQKDFDERERTLSKQAPIKKLNKEDLSQENQHSQNDLREKQKTIKSLKKKRRTHNHQVVIENKQLRAEVRQLKKDLIGASSAKDDLEFQLSVVKK